MTFQLRALAYSTLFLTLSTPGLSAQSQPDSAAAILTAETASAQQPAAAPISEAPFQGLPRRAPEPRTLHEFWPAFVLLSVTWLGIVVYIVGFRAPLRRIADSMRRAGQGGAS